LAIVKLGSPVSLGLQSINGGTLQIAVSKPAKAVAAIDPEEKAAAIGVRAYLAVRPSTVTSTNLALASLVAAVVFEMFW